MKVLLFLILFFFTSPVFCQVSNNNFFPIGVWLQEPNDAQAYKNAGINLFIGLWNPLDQPQLIDLQNAGMKVICDQNNFGLSHLNDTTIFGWMQMDEPDNAQWNAGTQQYDSCINPAVIINNYNLLKANDSIRPVFLNLGQGVSYIDYIGRGHCHAMTNLYPVNNNGYLSGCDISSFDIYPVNNSDTTTSGNLWYVAKGIDSLLFWSGNTKPAWCFIETTKISVNSPRKPSASEVKSEVWMAIIHGAKGFGYFCHSFVPPEDDAALLHDTAMLAAVTNINNEITILAPVLNSASTIGYASVISTNSSVPIDIMTKNYGGYDYIFAAAMRGDSTTAFFSVTAGTVVEVIGENRTININTGQFTDSFTSYGVHLYKISTVSEVRKVFDKSRVRLFPNPAFKSITVDAGISDKKLQFQIYDYSSRLVYKSSEFTSGLLNANLEKIMSGIYLYCLESDDHEVFLTGKIVIN